MKKVKRVLCAENGSRGPLLVWEAYSKIGTHSGGRGYFFDEPKVGLITDYVKVGAPKWEYPISVHVDRIDEEGRVFCSQI